MDQPHYPYQPITDRPKFTWRGGERLAVIFTINIEAWSLTRPTKEKIYQGGPGILPDPTPGDIPDWPNYTWREYGQRVGFWRLVDIFDRHGISPSCTINTRVCEQFPRILEAGLHRGWEFVAHGEEQGVLLTEYAYDIDAERQVIANVVDKFHRHVGKRPLGWLSSSCRFTANTPRILAEQGFLFHCDYQNDDQPFVITIDGHRMAGIPFNIEINDYTVFFRRNFTTDEWLNMLVEAFDVLYDECVADGQGRLMNIGLHPHVIGAPFRIRSIEHFLNYLDDKHGVFYPTREEIANWTLKHLNG